VKTVPCSSAYRCTPWRPPGGGFIGPGSADRRGLTHSPLHRSLDAALHAHCMRWAWRAGGRARPCLVVLGRGLLRRLAKARQQTQAARRSGALAAEAGPKAARPRRGAAEQAAAAAEREAGRRLLRTGRRRAKQRRRAGRGRAEQRRRAGRRRPEQRRRGGRRRAEGWRGGWRAEQGRRGGGRRRAKRRRRRRRAKQRRRARAKRGGRRPEQGGRRLASATGRCAGTEAAKCRRLAKRWRGRGTKAERHWRGGDSGRPDAGACYIPAARLLPDAACTRLCVTGPSTGLHEAQRVINNNRAGGSLPQTHVTRHLP